MNEKPRKILVIDGDKKFIKSLAMYFGIFRDRISFNSFENAEQSMETLSKESFDVIICDYWSLGVNGIAFFKSIQKLQPDSRKILIASYDNFDDVFDGFSDEGIDDVISKPLTGTDIEKFIQIRVGKNMDKRGDSVRQCAREIVRRHVYKSIGVGLIPVPAVDFVGQTAIQMNMLKRLAEVYDVPFSKEIGKKMIASLAGGYLPLYSSGIFGSFMKSIPVLGQTVGILNLSILAGIVTYVVGDIFIRYFEEGGTILNSSPDKKEGDMIKAFGKRMLSGQRM